MFPFHTINTNSHSDPFTSPLQYSSIHPPQTIIPTSEPPTPSNPPSPTPLINSEPITPTILQDTPQAEPTTQEPSPIATLEPSPQAQNTQTDPQMEPPMPPPHTLRTSTRTKTLPTKLKEFQCTLPPSLINNTRTKHHHSHYINYNNLIPTTLTLILCTDVVREPHSFTQAPKHPKWREAMDREILALEQNNTWVYNILPPGKVPIGCKWVYKIKLRADGTIERFKARLVTKGYNQKEGVDYTETFAPVAKMPTVRTLIAIAVYNGWEIQQLDVNNAFLHGDLNEEVYMTVPQGCNKSLPPNTVCKLSKSLYGLKQANRQRFEKLTTFLTHLGFKQSYVDTSLFTINHQGSLTAILVYVGDILITGKDTIFIQHIKSQLHNKFSIKDLGHIHYYLGVEILRNSTGLAMSQRKYALDLLKYADTLDLKPVATPMDPIVKLNDKDGDLLPDPTIYRTIVGKLIYLTITRPDLSFAAQALSQFSHCPRTPHFAALQRVLRYIKLCPGQGIFFPAANTMELTTYCDSDWAICATARRSVS